MSDQGNEPIDREELFRIFQSQYDYIIGIARRYAPAPDLAYDIVQQVFIEFVYSNPQKRWDLRRDIRPLLYQITKIQATKLWQRRRRESAESIQSVGRELAALCPGEQLLNESGKQDELDALNECMSALPAESVTLMEEHYRRNITIESIARIQNVKPGSVRQVFFRIRKKLRECIEKKLKRQ